MTSENDLGTYEFSVFNKNWRLQHQILQKSFQQIHYSYTKTDRPLETTDAFFFSIQVRSHNICVFSEDDQPIRAQQYQAYNALFTRIYLRIFILLNI